MARRGQSALALLAVTGSLAACGGTSGTTTSSASGSASTTGAPTGTATATAAPTGAGAVVAVLTSSGGAGPQELTLVQLDGTFVNTPAIQLATPPEIGPAVPILPPSAVVAAARLYVLDGDGNVHSLDRTGADRIAGHFATPKPQGYQSLAVSPGGDQLMSTSEVLSAVPSPGPGGFPEGPSFQQLTVDLATSDGATTRIRTVAHPDEGPNFAPPSAQASPTEGIGFVEGWDDAGPIEALHPLLGTQNGHPFGFSSPIAHVDLRTGVPSGQIGGSGCVAIQTLRDGTTLCDISAPGDAAVKPDVRDEAGHSLWRPVGPGGGSTLDQLGYYFTPVLSPGGDHVALQAGTGPGSPTTRVYVASRDGSTVDLPLDFTPSGWIDDSTLIGAVGPGQDGGELSYVRLSDPKRRVPLGVTGEYVGAL